VPSPIRQPSETIQYNNLSGSKVTFERELLWLILRGHIWEVSFLPHPIIIIITTTTCMCRTPKNLGGKRGEKKHP
jgi:hypothetical protein